MTLKPTPMMEVYDISDILSDEEQDNIEDKARKARMSSDYFVLLCLYKSLVKRYGVVRVQTPSESHN